MCLRLRGEDPLPHRSIRPIPLPARRARRAPALRPPEKLDGMGAHIQSYLVIYDTMCCNKHGAPAPRPHGNSAGVALAEFYTHTKDMI